jgi:alpha-tubulin suppressor-like RCC1 family protein
MLLKIGTDKWKSIQYIGDRYVGVKTDGTLWACGKNSDVFLGTGDYSDKITPVKISEANDWVSVSSNGASYLVLNSKGEMFRVKLLTRLILVKSFIFLTSEMIMKIG